LDDDRNEFAGGAVAAVAAVVNDEADNCLDGVVEILVHEDEDVGVDDELDRIELGGDVKEEEVLLLVLLALMLR
jgi:hypothetical protein